MDNLIRVHVLQSQQHLVDDSLSIVAIEATYASDLLKEILVAKLKDEVDLIFLSEDLNELHNVVSNHAVA